MKKICKDTTFSPQLLPVEALYLNRTAAQTAFGTLPQPVKHFVLKKKSKAAALKTELMQKCKLCFSIVLTVLRLWKSYSIPFPTPSVTVLFFVASDAAILLKTKGGAISSVVPIRPRNLAKKFDNNGNTVCLLLKKSY